MAEAPARGRRLEGRPRERAHACARRPNQRTEASGAKRLTVGRSEGKRGLSLGSTAPALPSWPRSKRAVQSKKPCSNGARLLQKAAKGKSGSSAVGPIERFSPQVRDGLDEDQLRPDLVNNGEAVEAFEDHLAVVAIKTAVDGRMVGHPSQGHAILFHEGTSEADLLRFVIADCVGEVVLNLGVKLNLHFPGLWPRALRRLQRRSVPLCLRALRGCDGPALLSKPGGFQPRSRLRPARRG
jgi:hypothetical protein